MSDKSLRAFRIACITVLGLSLARAVPATWHWPLVGDASLMHYVVFLAKQGRVPYRDIADVNFPGSYLYEAAGMKLFGDGAGGLRLLDLSLSVAAIGACVAFAGAELFGGLLAGGLFVLVHLADGVAQQGQRDLLLAVLLLCSLVALQRAETGGKAALFWSFSFGLLQGASLTVKPVLLPAAIALLALAALLRARGRRLRLLLPAILGCLLPCLGVGLWLWRLDALGAFWTVATTLVPLHAALARRSFPFLLFHSMAPVSIAVVGWLILLFLSRPAWGARRLLLHVALLGALAAYVVQGKALPYQRYPFLAVLLLLIGSDVDRTLRQGGRGRKFAVALTLLLTLFAPLLAAKAVRLRPSTSFSASLSSALLQIAPASALAGQVQCLDTFGGCVNTLYDLRLPQSTGFLYDCYLFAGNARTVSQYRQRFWQGYIAARPRVIVVTERACFDTPATGYARLAGWPAFANDLALHYRIVKSWQPSELEGWSSRKSLPPGYEILLRRDEQQ